MSPDSKPVQDCQSHQYQSLENIYEYVVTADGSSSHQDNIGGWAAIVTSKVHSECKQITTCGTCTYTDVARAELMAILSGLHSILVKKPYVSKFDFDTLETVPATILIVTDRKDLADIINWKGTPTSNLDLWYQFEWYLQYFNISATHIPGHKKLREEHERVDCLASLARVNFVDYINIQREVKHIRDEC